MRSSDTHPSPRLWTDTLLQDVLDAAPDATLGADEAGRIVVANTRVTDIFGYDRAELLGQYVELLIPERLRERHRGNRSAYSTSPHHRNMGGLLLAGRRRDGTSFPIEVSLNPIETIHGVVVLAAIRDVEERLRLEARAASLAGAARMKTDMLNILSHELFTPITTQGTAATLLNTDLARVDIGAMQALVSGVSAASVRLRRLTRFIDLAAAFDADAVPHNVQGVPVGAIIDRAIADTALTGREVHLRATDDDRGRHVLVDGELAELALVVVLENASAMAPGEPIDIELAPIDGWIEVKISDRGPGIPEDMRERIFELFTQVDASDTRHHDGTGIGLYLAGRIVGAYGGDIRIHPRDPHGSSFVLPFPLA
jgi:PAS domain S-box-containing protein